MDKIFTLAKTINATQWNYPRVLLFHSKTYNVIVKDSAINWTALVDVTLTCTGGDNDDDHETLQEHDQCSYNQDSELKDLMVTKTVSR